MHVYTVVAIAPTHIGGRTVPRGFLFDHGSVERVSELDLVRDAYATLHPHLHVLATGEELPPAPERAEPTADDDSEDASAALEKKTSKKSRKKNTHKNMKHG